MTEMPATGSFRAEPATDGCQPRRLAAFLPIVVALCGLTAIAVAPRLGDAAPGIDPVVTGSIQAAPLFQNRIDAPR